MEQGILSMPAATRRDFFRRLATGVLVRESGTAVDELLSLHGPWKLLDRHSRGYRVDATVMAFGMPLVSRSDAGSAVANVERYHGTAGKEAMILRFGAGSW